MAPTLKKIIVLSDIHLTSDGKKIADLYPFNKLKAAINHLLEKHKDLEHLVFTGDLAWQIVDLKVVKSWVPTKNEDAFFILSRSKECFNFS